MAGLGTGSLLISLSGRLVARLSRGVSWVSRSRVNVCVLDRRGILAGLAGCERVEASQGGGELGRPGPSAGDLHPEAASAADETDDRGEEAGAEPFWVTSGERAVQEYGYPGKSSWARATISHQIWLGAKPCR